MAAWLWLLISPCEVIAFLCGTGRQIASPRSLNKVEFI
jgi:hypothetical protein